MFEIFKTVLLLSLLGGGITLVLVMLKPLTLKRFPARWQYYVWLIATICMIIPVWKAIPAREVQKITPMIANEQTQIEIPDNTNTQSDVPTTINEDPPMEYRKIEIGNKFNIRIYDLIAYVWFAGMCIFIVSAFISYAMFLLKKRKHSFDLSENAAFEEVKNELNIKRKIKIRISNDDDSPMLTGTFFPIIYIPKNNMDVDMEKMVFRHELTHYKHGDLIYKWIVLFVNAIHWFNPFVYMLGSNISEACEIACDMSVISNMDEENKNLYMKTILNIAER